MVTHVAEHFLGAGHGDRRFCGNLAGNGKDPVEQRGLIIIDPVDQADAQRLLGIDVASGVGQLTHDAVTDDTWQTLQGADIGGHAHVDFLDRELRTLAAVAHVARRDEVDGAADAISLHRRQYRLAAFVHGRERRLQALDGTAQQARVAANVLAQLAGQRGQHHQIDASREMLARAADDHDAHRIGVVDPLEDVDDLLPEGGVHRVELFRAVDLYVGDAVAQLDLERTVLVGFLDQLGHGRHSCGKGFTAQDVTPPPRPYLCQKLDCMPCLRRADTAPCAIAES
ncbi:hypothetical protein D3C79_685830 [compost metagenome]